MILPTQIHCRMADVKLHVPGLDPSEITKAF